MEVLIQSQAATKHHTATCSLPLQQEGQGEESRKKWEKELCEGGKQN